MTAETVLAAPKTQVKQVCTQIVLTQVRTNYGKYEKRITAVQTSTQHRT